MISGACKKTALIVVLMVLTVEAARPSWWSCVRDIGMYFEPKSDTEFDWAVNPCGYAALSVEDVRNGVYFRDDNLTVSFAGDSTALRAYVFSVNSYLPPLNIPVVRKVASVPRVMTHTAHGRFGGAERSCRATFYNMRYVSTSEREIEESIMNTNGGVVVITLGNWDLNWKLQRNSPMPKLRGGVHNFEAAKVYWTEHVSLMAANIAKWLKLKDAATRPLIVFREQFLPNCDASRFTSKKSRYRRCAPLIRPIVVPLYRRVLAPLVWSLNIPVVPMDHVFRDGYRYCAMGDGIHLDFNCMMTEQQHIWNVVLLMRRHNVVQGLGTVNPGLTEIPNAKQFLNVSRFEEWRKSMDLHTPSATSPPDLGGVAAGSGLVTAEDDGAALLGMPTDEDVPRRPPPAYTKEEAIVLRTEARVGVATPTLHLPTTFGDAVERWHRWLLGTFALCCVTWYVLRAAGFTRRLQKNAAEAVAFVAR